MSLLNSKKHSKSTYKKVSRRSYNSPTSLKENLENKFNMPNISPFDDNRQVENSEVNNTRMSINPFDA
jgi:hypothetical protein